MSTWSLEKAKNGFSEVVRQALDGEPQIVTRGRNSEDAVVVVKRTDYERLVAPKKFGEFMRTSPLAQAFAENAWGDDPDFNPFARQIDEPRNLDIFKDQRDE